MLYIVEACTKNNNCCETDNSLYADISPPGSYLTFVQQFRINHLGYYLKSMQMALHIGCLTCFGYGVSDASVLYLPGMDSYFKT
jgi:hypothetical protein